MPHAAGRACQRIRRLAADKGSTIILGLRKNTLDYVIRRFNESSAELWKLVGLDLRWAAA
jgi:hypothetical protein